VNWPQVVLVNGPSSAGKTSLCRALQARMQDPYLCVGFDDFIFFSAPRYYERADTSEQSAFSDFTRQGVEMVKTSGPGAPTSVTAVFGPVFRHLIDSMAPAVRTLVDGGNPVIFDHVLHDRAMYESCIRAFDGLDVFTVGVTCPVEELERRERSRGDRVIGRARGLIDVVHQFCTYHMVVDTGAAPIDALVMEVLDGLQAPRRVEWRALAKP
jgi:chloramphenicol 3-O phosphotransferase